MAMLREKYEIVAAMFHGFDYSRYFTGTPKERLATFPATMERILALKDDKTRFMVAVLKVSKCVRT